MSALVSGRFSDISLLRLTYVLRRIDGPGVNIPSYPLRVTLNSCFLRHAFGQPETSFVLLDPVHKFSLKKTLFCLCCDFVGTAGVNWPACKGDLTLHDVIQPR